MTAANSRQRNTIDSPNELAKAQGASVAFQQVLSAAHSCVCFSQLRNISRLIISNRFFENFILFVILCNCVTLALSSNRINFDATALGKALAIFDYVYIGIFTLEMMLKVIAMGFILEKGAYLRDGWNVLDFLVVVMGYVSLVTPSNLTAIRAFRAMRPLRTINRVKGMKVLVNTLLGSLPMLMDVFLLCAFTFFLFSLIAVQLFAGVLRYRCGVPDFSGAYNVMRGSWDSGPWLDGGAGEVILLANVSYEVPDDQAELMCSGPLSSEVVWYLVNGTPKAVPGKPYAGRACDEGMYCTLYGNPDDGLLSYDNILWSWLTVFQHITLSGWTDVMYMVMDAVNYWVWIFYVALIIFGAFFMVNLALAVIAVHFSAADSQEVAAEDAEVVGTQGPSGGNTAGGRSKPELGVVQGPGSGAAVGSPSGLVALLRARRRSDSTDPDAALAGSPPPPGLGRFRSALWRVAVSWTLDLSTAVVILINTAVMCVNWYGMSYSVEAATDYINYVLTVYFVAEITIRLTAFGFYRFFRNGMNIFDFVVTAMAVVEMVMDLLPGSNGLGPLSVLRAFRLLRVFRLVRNWRELNALICGIFRSIVASIMLVGLMLLFMFIASLVGMQVFGYKFMFCDYVEGASPVCPPGQQVWGQCPNHFHCYLPCSDEQYGNWIDAPGSFYNGLAYCDRFCANGGGGDAAAAADSNSTAAAAAAVDAASGCEYLAMVGKSQVPRANFDNVLWGMYTVFQLLTGENWNDVMMDGMRSVSPWSSLYFVGVILVGNYLVFNLFIAILLDNLNSKMEEEAAAEATGGGNTGSSSRKGRREDQRPALPPPPPPPLSPSGTALAPPQLDLDCGVDAAVAASSACGRRGDAGSPGCVGGGVSFGGDTQPLSCPPPPSSSPSPGFPGPDPEPLVALQLTAAAEPPNSAHPQQQQRQQRERPLRRWGPGGIESQRREEGAEQQLSWKWRSSPGRQCSSDSRVGVAAADLGPGTGKDAGDSGQALAHTAGPHPLSPVVAGPASAATVTAAGRATRDVTPAPTLGCDLPGAAATRPPTVSLCTATPVAIGSAASEGGCCQSAPEAAVVQTVAEPRLVPAGPVAESVEEQGAVVAVAAVVAEAVALGVDCMGGVGHAAVLRCHSGMEPPRPLPGPSTALPPAPLTALLTGARSPMGCSTLASPVDSGPVHAAITVTALIGDHGGALAGAPMAAAPAAAAAAAPEAAPASAHAYLHTHNASTGGSGDCSARQQMQSSCTGATAKRSEMVSLDLEPQPQFQPRPENLQWWQGLKPDLQPYSPKAPSGPFNSFLGREPCLPQPKQHEEPGQHHQQQEQQQHMPLLQSLQAASWSRSLQPTEGMRKVLPWSCSPLEGLWKGNGNGGGGSSSAASVVGGGDHSGGGGAPASSAAASEPPWKEVLQGRALFLLGPDNWLRWRAALLVHHHWFEGVILLLILASSVSLALDSPSLDRSSTLAAALRIMDYVFTGAFTLEAALKILAFGFAFTGRHAYLRSGWNVLDLGIVLVGWALIAVELAGLDGGENVKALCVLRALRPLRAVRRFAGLRVVVDTLFAVLPAMANVALVCVFFYLMFAILTVDLFKGKLYNCIDAASGERIDPFYVMPYGDVLTRPWCEAGSQNITQSAYYTALNITMPEYTIDTQWINPTANFDNVGIAMLTLFQAATLSLWVDITFSAVDAVGVDKQPLWNHSPWVVLFFVVFILVCSFFVLNLFIGVTLDKFAQMQQERHSPSAFLTSEQQSWIRTQRLLLRAKAEYAPPRPAGCLRGALHRLVGGRGFEVFMLLVILANVVFMTLVHVDMSAAWQAVMSYSNLVFTVIFLVEAVLKITALGPLGYFRDGWNCFDCFVAAASVVSVALVASDTKDISFMPVMRVLRVVRVVRLVRHAEGMHKLLLTLITSLPALVNVGGIMLLFFFIFAVIGVNLFYGIKQGDNLDDHVNFDTLPNALLLLFMMLTGEGWNAVMQDCMRTDTCVLVLQDVNVTLPGTTSALLSPSSSSSPGILPPPLSAAVPSTAAPAIPTTTITIQGGTYLDPSDPLLAYLPPGATNNQCPLSPVAAIIYFPTFVILCSFILLQLVIAVLRENLLEADEQGSDVAGDGRPVPKAVIDSFTRAWGAAAAQATASGLGCRGGGLLHVSVLPGVLAATEPPLGARGRPDQRQEVQRLLLRARIPLYKDNQVSFIEVLHSLAGSMYGTALPPREMERLNRKLSRRRPREEPHPQYTAAHYHAANTVAAAVRAFLVRHHLRKQTVAAAAAAAPAAQHPPGGGSAAGPSSDPEAGGGCASPHSHFKPVVAAAASSRPAAAGASGAGATASAHGMAADGRRAGWGRGGGGGGGSAGDGCAGAKKRTSAGGGGGGGAWGMTGLGWLTGGWAPGLWQLPMLRALRGYLHGCLTAVGRSIFPFVWGS